MLDRFVRFALKSPRAKRRCGHTVVVDYNYIERTIYHPAEERRADRRLDLRGSARRGAATAQQSVSSIRVCPFGESACEQSRYRSNQYVQTRELCSGIDRAVADKRKYRGRAA